jgi:RNA polymerase sigma-54 factor
MVLQQKLSTKLVQKLIMTPSLQQAIKLLQLSRLELESVLKQELVDNPVLEEVNPDQPEQPAAETAESKEEQEKEEAEPDERDSFDEIDYESFFQDYTDHQVRRETDPSIEYPSFESTLTRRPALSDHLLWQLRLSFSSSRDIEIGTAIIGNISKDGYLRASIEEIMVMNDYSRDEVENVLNSIQAFDPIGIGARDLKECLLIQARYLGLANTEVMTVIADHLHLLETRKYPEIARQLRISQEEVQRYVDIIRQLDPKPGAKFSTEQSHYVVPDVYVVKSSKEYVIFLNEDGLPRFRVSAIYKRMLNPNAEVSKEVANYVKEKFKSAVWLMKSFEQRQRTIYKVAESIVKNQREFFDHGVHQLKPLVLRDVAEDINMHESTVSRVVNNKYMHTPQGVYEMKFFFHRGIDSSSGDNVSSMSIKQTIKDIISSEDPNKPFSDSKIVTLLKSKGLNIARRTVAKYRVELKIPPSKMRKKA